MIANPPTELSTDDYYVKLFVDNPAWSSPQPNEDEAARWEKISSFLQSITATKSDKPRRILDVGCGRGWLTNLASEFGECEGVEPVAPVIVQARQLFPQLRFTAGFAGTILETPDFEPYDIVVTSEVIEHVPQAEKADFARQLARLLKPGGHVILTTPRGESLREWTRLAGDPSQPVEEWLCEPELRELFLDEGFTLHGHERVLFDAETRRFVSGAGAGKTNQLIAIYQVWAFQRPADDAAVVLSKKIETNEVLAEFHSACRDAAERALQNAPDHPELLTTRASAFLNLGDLEEARRQLIWTVALHAEYIPARRLLAEVLWRCNLPEEAEAQTARVLELDAEAKDARQSNHFSFVKNLHRGVLLAGNPSQLEVRRATIQNHPASCIYLHPPATLRFEVPNGVAGRFTTAIAIQPEAWNQPSAGGCEFTLLHNGREVFRKAINPRQVAAHRCWHEVEIEVPVSQGAAHEFVFRTQAIGVPPDFRWALWRDPVFRPHAETQSL